MTIAQVLQCKKSKSSNQNTIQAHYTLHTNNVNVKSSVYMAWHHNILPRRTTTLTSPICPSWSARSCKSVSADKLRRTFICLRCCCRLEVGAVCLIHLKTLLNLVYRWHFSSFIT